MNSVLYILTVIAIVRTAQAIVQATRFRRLFQMARDEPDGNFTPKVALLAPFKGMDPGLPDQLRSLLSQEYPDYEVIFVLESSDDPAAGLLRSAVEHCSGHRPKRIATVIAGPSTDCGQKVHNLKSALRHVSRDVEIYAFIDSDVLPHSEWLRGLVAPLKDEAVGVSTGYRWFLPVRGGLASGMLTAWNALPLSLLSDPRWIFAWGGSMAIRRMTFDDIDVLGYWSGSISDDYGVTKAVQNAGLKISFVPACLVLSFQDMTWDQLWEFICRQFTITRIYAPGLWRIGLIFSVIYTGAFFVSPLFGAIDWMTAGSGLPLLVGSLFLWGMTTVIGYLRLSTARLRFPGHVPAHRKTALAQILGGPFLAPINLFSLIIAGFSRRIKWRGITYHIRSANEVSILARE